VIVTVTLNPSLDLTYALAEDELGQIEVHRARTITVEASGKGVNVSRTLHAAGVATIAVLPEGGQTGQHLGDLLAAEGLEHVPVPVGGHTRINTSLLLANGQTVKVNGPGAPMARPDLDRLLDILATVLSAGLPSAALCRRASHRTWWANSSTWPIGIRSTASLTSRAQL
jgi:1-phosphofructokinase